MPYHVVALTIQQVRSGSLLFQRTLGSLLKESPAIKVYSASPFDMDERRRLRERFGGDIVYFFNPAAHAASLAHNLDLNFAAEIPDADLPKRRTVVVGLPE